MVINHEILNMLLAFRRNYAGSDYTFLGSKSMGFFVPNELGINSGSIFPKMYGIISLL